MNTRSSQIQTIINHRKSNVPRLKEQYKALELDIETVSTIVEKTQRLSGKNEISIANRLKDESELLSQFLRGLQTQRESLDALIRRLDQPYLTIGVLGDARQGKSTLLQSLTGLSPDVIPSGSKDDCTGTQIRVVHSDDEPRATVYPYSRQELFNELISPYFLELSIKPPPSLEAFAQGPAPKFSANGKSNDLAIARMDTLQRIHTSIGKLIEIAEKGKPIPIDLSEVRYWVAQDDKAKGGGDHPYFAVRWVEIKHPFPQSDLTGIRVIDTKGLGDVTLGNLERILRLVMEEADIITVLFKPDPHGFSIKDNLLDLTSQITTNLPGELGLADLGFLVLNEVGENPEKAGGFDNRERCRNFQSEIRRLKIGVVDTLITDCATPTSVEQSFLEPILNHLLAQIHEHDNTRIGVCLRDIDEIRKKMQAGLRKIRQLAREELDILDREGRFEELFAKVWAQISAALWEARDRAWNERKSVDEDFLESLDETHYRAQDEQKFSADEMKRQRLALPRGSIMGIWGEEMHILRTRLAATYESLIASFGSQRLSRWKLTLKEIMLNQGRLNSVLPEPEKADIVALRNLILEHAPSSRRLAGNFEWLDRFSIEYPYVLHVLRKQLYDLDPEYKIHNGSLNSSIASKDQEQQGLDKIADSLSEYAEDNLSKAYKKSVNQIYEELQSMADLPASICWAFMAELFDRLVVTEGIYEEWRRFYRHIADKIWFNELRLEVEFAPILAELVNDIERYLGVDKRTSHTIYPPSYFD